MTKRGMPKPFAILVAVLMALYFVPLNALPASAAGVDGGFEIDGNFVDDPGPGIDWANVLTAPSGQDNNPENTVFSASAKEGNDPDTWSPSGSPPGKADFSNYYSYDRVVSGHAFFFFGWERVSPSGSDGYFLELNKLPTTSTRPMSASRRGRWAICASRSTRRATSRWS